jgi:hypothetical protein
MKENYMHVSVSDVFHEIMVDNVILLKLQSVTSTKITTTHYDSIKFTIDSNIDVQLFNDKKQKKYRRIYL